jgi:2-hydroxy-6-oxonona-2,4-dienedioate hydrolase
MILLVHGLGLSHRYFARLQPLLPGARAVDLEGTSLEQMTASLARVAEPGTLVVANSLGTQIATELAARSPELVRGLVLSGPTWDPEAPSLPAQFLRLLADSYREQPSLVPVALADYARRGPWHIFRAARSMLRHSMVERLAQVSVPVVIVRGSADPICGQRWAERLAAAPADGRLVTVHGAAHAVDWSHPGALVQAVEEVQQALGER